jgi:hypothetical protein
LVQGADHAFYTFSFTTQHLTVEADYDCDLKDGGALCSALDPSSHTQTLAIPSASMFPLVLDVVSTAAAQATNKPNSSARLSVSISGALVGLVLAYRLL